MGFKDATRADFAFHLQLCSLCHRMGVTAVRYAGSLGNATPGQVYQAVWALKQMSGLEIRIHAHNDFGMAVANSVAAVAAGAINVDCTLKGTGEGASNCDYNKLVKLMLRHEPQGRRTFT